MIELASETDFVAKNEQFQQLAERDRRPPSPAPTPPTSTALREVTLDDGKTVAERVEGLAAVIGEKLELRRGGQGRRPGGHATCTARPRTCRRRSACSSATQGSDLDSARTAAMQIAAMRPAYLTRDQVPAEVVETEKRVAEAKAREDGKPEAALPKIIEGTVNGYFKNNVLLEQASVVDNKKTVKALLDEAGVTVTGFAHFEVGQ